MKQCVQDVVVGQLGDVVHPLSCERKVCVAERLQRQQFVYSATQAAHRLWRSAGRHTNWDSRNVGGNCPREGELLNVWRWGVANCHGKISGGDVWVYMSLSLLHMGSAIATFKAAAHHHTLAGTKL